MTIKTRYRDIPWDETGCPTTLKSESNRKWEEKHRGRQIFVEVPSCNSNRWRDRHGRSTCDQPKYLVVDRHGIAERTEDGHCISVCPHIAEIGD